jgi:hypothetical protein
LEFFWISFFSFSVTLWYVKVCSMYSFVFVVL